MQGVQQPGHRRQGRARRLRVPGDTGDTGELGEEEGGAAVARGQVGGHRAEPPVAVAQQLQAEPVGAVRRAVGEGDQLVPEGAGRGEEPFGFGRGGGPGPRPAPAGWWTGAVEAETIAARITHSWSCRSTLSRAAIFRVALASPESGTVPGTARPVTPVRRCRRPGR